MKHLAIFGVAIVLFGTASLVGEDKPTQPNNHRIELPLKTPRTREPALGGAKDKVYFNVWIPPGVKNVRGAICNPFSQDQPVSNHWQAACRHWQFAFVQTDFDGVKKEEYALLQTALAEIAKKSGHPESEKMPLCFTGMSRGGGMSMNLAELLPERTIASVPVCLEVGPISAATRNIPVLTIFGEKDGSQMNKLLEKLPTQRKQDARWSLAVQWNRRHEFGQANNLSLIFLDDVIAKRVPAKPGALRDYPIEEGYIADQTSWSKEGKRASIVSVKEFKGKKDKVGWLPSKRSAVVWQAFVSSSKEITLEEPAGLGDKQKFVSHSSEKAIQAKVKVAGKRKVSKVELWDADNLLAQKTSEPWTFEVKLAAGIHSLFAVTHEGDEVRNSRPHTIVVEAGK